jgi:tRNA threonylcarbamoyladenosine biosynthesis protein TsaB
VSARIETVLALDAATSRATVAVLRGGVVVAAAETAGGRDERLLPVVVEMMAAAGVEIGDLTGIVCGAGPGSFTGLRVAASIAKGLAAGRELPLSVVSSLLLIVAGLPEGPPPGRYLASLDAMRGERFVAAVAVDGGSIVMAGLPRVVSAVDGGGELLIGPGCAWDAWPHVRGIARLGAESVMRVDLEQWEPTYGRQSAAEDRRAGT